MGEPRRALAALGLAVLLLFVFQGGGATADEQIVGGGKVSIAQYPYTVYLATPDGFQFCGGAIVAPTKIVTAAHCVHDLAPARLRVVAGRDDKLDVRHGTATTVSHIWVHPSFTGVRNGADIAVLTVTKRLRYRAVRLAGSSDAHLYQAGTSSTILGWGRTAEGGQTSRYLLGATVPVVTDAACGLAYANYVRAAMVCAGYPQGGVDSCQGDSGGPMLVGDVLVGIASWGEGCARPAKYGIYTRVASYSAEVQGQF